MLLLYLLAVLLCLLLLWRAGDIVIARILVLAARYKLSLFFVGFVLLALAANLPELAVAIMSALRGVSEVSAGDIVGANFNDIALVTGVTLVLAGSIGIKKRDAHNLLHIIAMATFVMAIVFFVGELSPIHGLALVTIYGIFLWWSWRNRHKHSTFDKLGDHQPHPMGPPSTSNLRLWAECCGGLVVILLASGGAVHCAIELAVICGFSLEHVGATIVALGTSLPEFALSIAAFRKGNYSLALGPTIGTVFGQATLILGVLALLSSKPVDLTSLRGTAIFMFIAFFMMACAIISGRIGRTTGIALLGLFLIYVLCHVVPGAVLG